jgi:hypothetical protein
MRTFVTDNRANYAGAGAQVLDHLNERAASAEFEAAYLCAGSRVIMLGQRVADGSMPDAHLQRWHRDRLTDHLLRLFASALIIASTALICGASRV